MTKPLLEKSNQSMLAAKLLVREGNHSSTVSRAYYSCFQYILHILIEKLGHTHAYIKTMPRDGIHSQAQYLLELTLVSKVGTDKSDYRWFQRKLPEFKQERVKADYYADGQDKGHEAINFANSIINTLKKYY